jgi:hypothetical protein
MNMLTRLDGVWLGDLDGRRVVIIDVDEADPKALKMVDDLLRERKERRHGRRNEHRNGQDKKKMEVTNDETE